MDLSVIIVSWNVKDKLRENLRSIFESRPLANGFEVFVVDNASADESAKMVRDEFPQVKLIANPENLGFAKANNQAIREAGGRYVLLQNPDMCVHADTYTNAVKWMDANPQAWVSGFKLVSEIDETVKHVRKFPTLFDQLMVVLKVPYFVPNILDDYLLPDFDYSKPVKVDSVRGGFFLIRRETIEKVGLLDEQFFVWFEEVDYCRRVKAAGGQVWYSPAADAVDFVGQSFKQLPRGRAQGYFRDSMLKYFLKWHGWAEYIILKMAWMIGVWLAVVGEKIGVEGKSRG